MPLSAVVRSEDKDGQQGSGGESAWNDAHDASGASNPDTNDNYNNYAIQAGYHNPPRDFYIVTRAFLDFNTSAINEPVTSGTLSLYITATHSDDDDIIALKSGHDPSDTTEDWFGTWLTGLGGTLSGWSRTDPEVIPYTEATGQDSGTGYLNIPLNAKALADIREQDSVRMVLMNYTYDYLDTAPSGIVNNGIYYRDYGTSRAPYLGIEINQTGEYDTINGITRIGSVNGISPGTAASEGSSTFFKINGT